MELEELEFSTARNLTWDAHLIQIASCSSLGFPDRSYVVWSHQWEMYRKMWQQSAPWYNRFWLQNNLKSWSLQIRKAPPREIQASLGKSVVQRMDKRVVEIMCPCPCVCSWWRAFAGTFEFIGERFKNFAQIWNDASQTKLTEGVSWKWRPRNEGLSQQRPVEDWPA